MKQPQSPLFTLKIHVKHDWASKYKLAEISFLQNLLYLSASSISISVISSFWEMFNKEVRFSLEDFGGN